MIKFSDSIKQSFCYNALSGTGNGLKVFTSAASGVTTAISVYSGVQPSAAQLVANWNPTYNGGTANVRLIHYNGANTNPTWERTPGAFTIKGFPTVATTAIGTGTASWAVIWSTNLNPTLASMSAATLPASINMFLIVPVTDISGNGVIRFLDLNFTSGQAKAIADGALLVV